ncbi:MAG: serine acetyltransferase [Candidatus Baltobacteraceae bacterium]
MKLTLTRTDLRAYINSILNTAFPDGQRSDVGSVLDRALERLEFCFQRIALRGYSKDGEATFDHLHGDQFAALIYFLSNTAWRERGAEDLAKKLCLLNRGRHGLLIMYDTQLPDIFLIPHTVSTVIGKASYQNYTVFCQGVTVGNDPGSTIAVGRGVVLFPGAFVTGKGSVGDYSVVSANSTVLYQDVPPNTVVSGRSPDLVMWERKRDFLARYFLPPYE